MKCIFKAIRMILSPFMLLWEFATTPKGIVRTPEAQQAIDKQTQGLALYQFKTCPFCIKVRRVINGLSLKIELRDAKNNEQHREALLLGGGRIKTPCLQITDEQGNIQWMYESADINDYLRKRFS